MTSQGDSATLLAATGVRGYAPEVPIVACVDLSENAGRVQRAGEIITDIGSSFVLTVTDEIYVCGTTDAVNGFDEDLAETG